MMGPPVRAISDLPDICQLRILSLLEKSEQPLKTAKPSNNGENGTARGIESSSNASFVQEAGTSKHSFQLSQCEYSPLVDAVDTLARNGYALVQGAVSNELVSHTEFLVLIAATLIVTRTDASLMSMYLGDIVKARCNAAWKTSL